MDFQVRYELLRKLQLSMKRSVPVTLLFTHINHWMATVPDYDKQIAIHINAFRP